MKKIIIFSDTHGDQKKLKSILDLEDYDYAIHAGDYECDLNFIKEHFDFHVGGNNDFDNNQKEIFFEIENIKFYLQHGHLMGNYFQLDNKSYMEPFLKQLDVDIIIHGHTHINKVWNFGTKFIINPGSLTYPRGGTKSSYILGIIDSNKEKINFEIKEAP